MGVLFTTLLGNPYWSETKKYTSNLLQLCVVGLGAGMNLKIISIVGFQGIGYTATGIGLTALVGWLLSKIFKTGGILTSLITIGTAICGGSAIAAVSPIMNANERDISLSLGIVFLLNALALMIFPPIGHMLDLSQHQFGLWAALAIHDTSSVVGASLQYGSIALEVATTVKLARALWIIPVAFVVALFVQKKTTTQKKIKKPWFILGFILLAALVTWIPALKETGQNISTLAKKLLVLTLFLIGSGLSLKSLKEVGLRPLLLGISLWIIVASSSLYLIKLNFIH